MDGKQEGHEEGLREQTFVLNEAFVEQAGMEGARRYAAVLADGAAYAEDHTEDEIAAFLRDRLKGTTIERDDHSYAITAGLLRTSGRRMSVVTEDGTVLHGAPEATADEAVPDVRGTEDPADPNRPFYS